MLINDKLLLTDAPLAGPMVKVIANYDTTRSVHVRGRKQPTSFEATDKEALSCESGKLGIRLVRYDHGFAVQQLDGYDIQGIEERGFWLDP
ncbi:MAG: hypothetical protein ACKPKO_50715, partial [Candidatus Fonsibacter sp.]